MPICKGRYPLNDTKQLDEIIRMGSVNRMEDAKLRETIIEELSKQPTMMLATAMMYARYMTVHGVSVVEQWKTAVQQSYALDQAERYGYAKAINNLKKRCEFCKYKDIITRQREKDGKQNGEI